MNIKEILQGAIGYFEKHQLPNARLDAEVLLAELLGMERIQLYVNYDLPLKDGEINRYRQLIKERARRIPVAYLTGHKEFMSLDIRVERGVLIPRPETELLVEEVIAYCQKKGLKEPHIVDLGTGSGAIAVSLGYYLSGARILGIDISEKALKQAYLNLKNYELTERVKLVKGDLLEPLLRLKRDNVDVVVSNPPYLSPAEMADLQPEVRAEPARALEGGEDGLCFYQRIIPQAEKVLRPGGLLALEIGREQGEAVRSLFGSSWREIVIKQDYAGCDRICLAAFTGRGRS